MRLFAYFALSICIAFTFGRAEAASVSFAGQSANLAFFVIEGELKAGDDDAFQQKIAPYQKGVVVFDSVGGNLIAGMLIGEAIRLRNFATWIPSGNRCASACALAWLGGTTKFMGKHSLIGFHAAHRADDGSEFGMANALVGKYLADLGLSYAAIGYITKAPPKSMTWLTEAEAAGVGIEISVIDEQMKVPEKRIQNLSI